MISGSFKSSVGTAVKALFIYCNKYIEPVQSVKKTEKDVIQIMPR